MPFEMLLSRKVYTTENQQNSRKCCFSSAFDAKITIRRIHGNGRNMCVVVLIVAGLLVLKFQSAMT